MNPLRLRATNLRTFPQLDWRIPEGTTAITGPNGAGKSTLLAGIELALFADGSRDLAPAMGRFGDALELTLEFEHAGSEYRVRRGYAKGKATLDVECWDDLKLRVWHPLTRESVRETQAFLEQTLGLSRATFGASAFLAQGQVGSFPEASPAERKALLGAILDPRETWHRLSNRALAERKIGETELQIAQTKISDREPLSARIPEIELQLEEARTTWQAAGQLHEDAASAHEQAKSDLAANAAAAERARAAEQAQRAALETRNRANTDLTVATADASQLAPAQATLGTLTERASHIPSLELAEQKARANELRSETAKRERDAADNASVHQQTKIANLQRDHDRKKRERDRIADELADYEETSSVPHCARCDQPLGAEARATAMRNAQADIAAYDAGLAKSGEELAEAERIGLELADHARGLSVPLYAPPDDTGARLLAARQANQERAGLAVRIQAYEAAAERLPALRQALADADLMLAAAELDLEGARSRQRDPDTLERAVADARLTASNRRVDLDEAAAVVTRTEQELERAHAARQELADLTAQATDLHALLDLLRLAERATGRDGIPALIAETTVPVLEAEANRILERLPTANGTVFRVEMRTQRALKSDAAVLKETLDILVSDHGGTREYLTYSGGERFRVGFALRWALSKLLRNHLGAQCDVLVIDEPDGLDAGGMDGLAAVLREEAGGFARVLLVSHSPLLATAFEQVVCLESDGEVSRMVEDE